jgi:CheY-like chemotaxis protein
MLIELGIPAIELGSAEDPEIERFAVSHGLDVGALRSLAAQTLEQGREVRASGNVVCLRQDGVLVMALRAPSPARGHDDGRASEEILHEVRNAITAVAGWARIARQEGGATVRADQALGAIEAAALVAMDAAAHRDHRGAIGARPVAIGALVAQARELLEPLARERKVALQESVAPELRVAIPRASALSAISNLIKNAIEASQPGDEVMIRASRTGGRGRGTVEITVANPSPSGVPRIGRSSKGPGRGVGLSVVSGIAEAAGGSLRFSRGAGGLLLASLRLPEPGAATEPSVEEVTAQLSRDRARHDGMVSGTRPAARARDESGARVLVVDDEHSIRSLVTTALSLAGIAAVAVAVPDEIADDGHVFELALVDLRLGDLDGLEVARQLQADGKVRRVVLMTGAPIGQKPADVLAIVRKPFDLDELQSRIAEWTAEGLPNVARARG